MYYTIIRDVASNFRVPGGRFIINMFTVVKCKHNHNSMHNMSNLPL